MPFFTFICHYLLQTEQRIFYGEKKMIKTNPEYRLQKITTSFTSPCGEIGIRPEPNTVCLSSENATCNGKVTTEISERL